MRRPVYPRAVRYPLLALALTATAATTRAGFISQTVSVDYYRDGTQADSDFALTTGSGPNDLGEVLADIAGGTYTATASAGRFGDIGLSTRLIVNARDALQVTVAGVEIDAEDVVTNPFSGPMRAASRFVIDGGELGFVGDPASSVVYELEVRSSALGDLGDDDSVAFSTSGRLGFGAAGLEFTTDGADIGAVAEVGLFSGSVRIPLSLQTTDLGTLQPGESLSLRYTLALYLDLGFQGETVSASFSDPLSLSGNPALGTTTLTPVTAAVPEPSALTLAGLGGVALLGRRWRGR